MSGRLWEPERQASGKYSTSSPLLLRLQGEGARRRWGWGRGRGGVGLTQCDPIPPTYHTALTHATTLHWGT